MNRHDTMVPAVSLDHVTVMYHNIPVLWDVSCSIAQGTLLAIMGPNGAGKTTLLKTMLNLIQPATGSIVFFNHDYIKVRLQIAYVPQRQTIDWDFPITVFDVALMGRYGRLGWFRRPQKADIDATWHALACVGLTDYAYTPINMLSGGQQQRVFIARALAQEAMLYILDEPFAGIDAPTETIIINLLKFLRDEGKTIIVVHHDMHTVATYFDWILLLNKKIIAYGPLSAVDMQSHIPVAYGLNGLSKAI
jgi:manganese/zinc/iron transport system ATP- binding protein